MQFNVAQLLKEPIGAVRRYQVTEDIGELDPDRLLLRTTSRRVTETIDVAQLLADYYARQTSGTVTPG